MTIPLLTPEKVKTDSSSQEQEQRTRVHEMSAEEERLVASINALRKEETDTRAEVRETVAKYRNDAQVEVHNITIEVTNLENRRAEAMKPIQQVQKETDDRNAASKLREDAVAKRETGTDECKKDLDDREATFLETSADTKQLQDEREQALDKREERVKQEEERSKESLDGLQTRWQSFHTTVATKEKELTEREAKVAAGEQANTIRAQEQEKKDLEQKEHDRQIADRYETLASSEREIIKGEVTLL